MPVVNNDNVERIDFYNESALANSATTGTVYFDDGTNTDTGTSGLMAYTGTAEGWKTVAFESHTPRVTAWTPTITGGGGGSMTYTSQVGYYVQIGTLVYATARIAWSAHTLTGSLSLDLPVSSGTLSSGVFGGNISYNNGIAVTDQLTLSGGQGNQYLSVYDLNVLVTTTSLTASGAFYFNSVYFVAPF